MTLFIPVFGNTAMEVLRPARSLNLGRHTTGKASIAGSSRQQALAMVHVIKA